MLKYSYILNFILDIIETKSGSVYINTDLMNLPKIDLNEK